MAVSCQFLSADWGNIADWGGVIAAAVVGYAVYRVSKRTNDLAAAANRTSDAMADLVQRQAQEAELLRQREQQLLLVALAAPVSRFAKVLDGLKTALEDDKVRKSAARDEEVQTLFIDALRLNALTIPDGIRDRMHFLDPGLAARILRAEGSAALIIDGLTDLHKSEDSDRAIGINTVHHAMKVQYSELESAVVACFAACRDAGLRITVPQVIGDMPGTQGQ